MSVERRVTVDTPSASYDVRIGPGLVSRVGESVRESTDATHIAIVTDETVAGLYGEKVAVSLQESGIHFDTILIPPGESSKTWDRAGDVLEGLARAGIDRTGAVVALGGGVVGDLAGFCAATYMRGISLVQVPTTLLAQVDSSVGGKTAVDLIAGKNLAGAFIQPRAVLADTSTLSSLSDTEWRSGMAEVAKSAVLDSEAFLGWLEANAAQLVARDPDAVQEAVRASVAFKARVVSLDERETGLREILNLGHTLGHAIEKVAGYGQVPHGIAVAEGMRFAARLAEKCAGASAEFTARQGLLLDSLGLTRLSEVYDTDDIRAAMSSDKKARQGRPRFVLAKAPGETEFEAIEEELLESELDAFIGEEDETS